MTKGEAIEMLVNATYSDEWQGNEKLTTAHLMAIEALKVQDRPKGEWVNDEHDMPRCSNCGYMPDYNDFIDDYYYSDFCPNCGSDMRGEDE